MPVLPGVLSLTSPADGAIAVAADIRNANTAIQAAVNALLGILDDGLAGQFMKGVGTTVSFDYPPAYEYGYTEFTSNVSVTATTEATANVIVTAPTITFDGSTTIIVDYFAENWDHTAAGVLSKLWLYESVGGGAAASIGELWRMTSASTADEGGLRLSRRLTPSAATHAYSVRGSTGSGTMRQLAGAGGLGNVMPGFIRVTKV